jgi:amino acid transporter
MTKSNKFGAFGGVFTPSILTILGVIMYMRLPMIIGQAGLFATLGIIVVAHIISITTGLSVSSIATDKKVKAGGTYYIISRSLGLPIGGTLGLALYVGLSFSVSLYLIGFAESFLGFWGYDININNIRIAGSIILLTVTIITFISASLAVKTQYLIMAAIFLSLLSIFFGKHEFTAAAPNFFGSTTGKAVPLMVLFGIYFPAVTGFEAGVSMSGDLKDPKSSIPKGTIAAIALGLLVYIFLAFFFSYTVNSEMLASDPNVLLKISWVPELVVAGIWGATLSSALGSILAAPRILQATAVDKITPKFFARGTKISNEPRNALILTFFIAECGILIGELDVIARIVSVFFITTYGFLNLSSAFEAKTSPDFRPDFKVPYWVGLIGALACMLVMIQLDFLAMMGATVILGLLYLYIKRKELTLESGDAWSSVWASLVKKALLRLNKSNVQSRNWRPNIIMFSGDLEARPYLSKFGIDLIGKLGMISGFELEPSKEQVLIKNVRTLSTSKNPSELIIHKHQCRDIYSGIDEIVRTYGFTGVEPNTILLGWSSKGINKDSYTQIIRSFQRNNFNSVFLSYDPVRKFGNQKTIDIWWNGWGYNFVFSIYLIRHLTSIGEWKDAKVRILVISNDNKLIEKSHETISNVLERYRVSMAVKVIDNSVDNYLKEDIINKESASCDLTIIGLPWESNHNIETVYNQTNRLAGLIGTALFINASSSFEEIDLGFDKGKSGVIDEPVFKEIISVPELQLSKYPKINENIHNIDANGQKVLEIFYLKTFVPYFLESNEFISEIKEIVQMTFNVYSKIPDINDLHKKQKALRAAKSDFYFHINKVLKKIIEEKLALQKQFLETGIDWYTKKLEEDILKFPQRLSINYEKDDFMIHKEDSASMRLFKFRKRISHPFSKKKITSNIRFREIAGYYLKDKRFQFLSHLLNKLEQDVITRASNLRPLITGMDNLIMKYEKQLQHKDFHKESFELEKNDLLERVQDILNSLASIQELYKNRFFVEFRQNLNVLAVEMSKVNINHLIVKKHKNRKYYKSIKLRNESFPEEFYFKLLYYFNKINLDVILRSLKHRIEDKLDKLSMSTTQNLEAGLIRKLEMIKSDALSIKEDPKKINSLKFDIGSIQESIHLQGAFEDLRDEIMELGESLPESLLITTSVIIDDQQKQDAEPEVISVPLRKIALHFLETHFLNSIFEYL